MLQVIRSISVFVAIVTAILVYRDSAHAQNTPEKTYTLTVTQADLNVLSQALDELPRKFSEPTIQKFQKQLGEQMKPVEAPKAEEKK